MGNTAKTRPFFSPSAGFKNQSASGAERLTLVDVGGSGDCGFRAVAAGLFDHIYLKSRFDDETIKKLLQNYFEYNSSPYTPPKGHLVTSIERMQFLVDRVQMGELITGMSYALRQMAVDEMQSNPSKYRGAFVRRHENTSPECMRKPDTWIDETSMAALANALDITIQVSVVRGDKRLPVQFEYHRETRERATSPIVIAVQLDREHYMPKLRQPEKFKNASSVKALEFNSKLANENELVDILKAIEKDDQRMLDVYHQTKNALSSALTAGEINKDDLMDVYISGMADSDYLTGRVKYIGLEYQNQDFFNEELLARRGSRPIETNDNNSLLEMELIHALSRAVSIGQMSEDQVFNADEKPSRKTRLS